MTQSANFQTWIYNYFSNSKQLWKISSSKFKKFFKGRFLGNPVYMQKYIDFYSQVVDKFNIITQKIIPIIQN